MSAFSGYGPLIIPKDLSTVSPCPDDQGLKIFPHYGYPLQFALWLQIMGQKEIGRIFVSAVPVGEHWYVGAYHTQQWTHDAKDPVSWVQAASAEAHLGHPESAYVKYDLAAKLLDGGGFVDLAMHDDVIKTRDAVMTKESFEAAVQQALAAESVVYTGSLFVEGGAGIVVRVRIPSEISLETLKSRCKKMVAAVAGQPWAPALAGVKCAFLLPGEKGQTDGAQGAVFMPMSADQSLSR